MSYLVYVTDSCREMAKNHNVLDTLENLAVKVESDQSISSWDRFLPEPAIRKSLGRSFRLVAVDKVFEDYNVVTFIGVWPRSSSDYNKFLENVQEFVARYEPPIEEYEQLINLRKERKNTPPALRKPSEIEYGYLYGNSNALEDENTIFESHDWVALIKNDNHQEAIARYYDLLCEQIISSEPEDILAIHKQRGAKILYRKFPILKCILLIAPLLGDNDEIESSLKEKYDKVLSEPENQISLDDLLKYSSRSYPEIILADEEQTWYRIEKNSEGNLALSPEESAILKVITSPEDLGDRYPLFINGRPGSGKSTILQYLFAHQLYLHLSKEEKLRLEHPPLYLTYSEKLLNSAKETVKIILKCNSSFIANEAINLDNEDVQKIIDNSFGEFHKYMLNYVSKELRDTKYRPEHYLQYSTFRREWMKHKRTVPDNQIRVMSPELAWHVIRTFIKGMSDLNDDYLSLEAYQDLSKDQQTVSIEQYELIFDKVWEKWYRPLCEDKGYWDNQDLTSEVLNCMDRDKFAKFPVIVCDEAQDFTRNELELILNLSIFSRRSLSGNELARVPFAFAGDPYQTLNPTGFNWNIVSAGFHEKIIKNLDRTSSGRLNMNYKELAYNYRSSKDIVGFTNYIQLLRGLLFEIKHLQPQRAWFGEDSLKHRNSKVIKSDDSRPLQYFDVDTDLCREMLNEKAELIIILPCQEGEEEEFVRNDQLLNSLTRDNYYGRNFLSPMQAKGLEFNTVVLYKFGADIAENYPHLFKPLETNEIHQGEAALPYEYFTNRLYVAVSRAKKNLLLFDTHEGIEYVWKNDLIVNYDKLIDAYNKMTNIKWSKDDVAMVEPGRSSSLDSSTGEDNPLDIAGSFRLSGMSERNSYLLRMSANNYRRANREGEAIKCEAYAYVFEENYKEAGLLFAKINMKKEALEYLWSSGNLDVIAENNIFIDSIYQKAAIFLKESKKAMPEIRAFVNVMQAIAQAYSTEPSLFRGSYSAEWVKVLGEIISCIINVKTKEGSHSDWEGVFENIKTMTKSNLLTLAKQQNAELAYRAGYFDEAAREWEAINSTNHISYYVAKSKTFVYPANVVWLLKGEAHNELIALLKENSFDIGKLELSEEEYLNVFDLLVKEGLFKEALELQCLRPNYDKIRVLYTESKKTNDEKLQQGILNILIQEGISGGKWDDIINYYEKQEFDEKNTNYANQLLIKSLAISEEFVNASGKRKKRMAEYLRKLLIGKKWVGIVDVLTAGAAIENANKVTDALDFYEMIWDKGKISASSREINEAKKRWLKRKYILDEVNKTTKHTIEADEKNENWGLNIDIGNLPQYPGFDKSKGAKAAANRQKTSLTKQQQQIILISQKSNMSINDIAKGLSISPNAVKTFLKEQKNKE